VQVELGDPGGGGRQERPVVADQHHRPLLAGQEPLQAGQAVEVEVVGRLVQQQHVEAGEQDGGQAGPDPLAARQPGQGDLEDVGVQADVGQDLRGAGVVVVAAEGEEAAQGVVVGLQLAPARGVADGGQGGLHGLLGHGQAGAPAQVGGGGLAREGVRLLGQVADVEAGRRPLDRAAGRGLQAGQAAQQGRLAGAVAAQHADAAGPVDDQVDAVEHDLSATDHGEVPGGEHPPAWHAGLRPRSRKRTTPSRSGSVPHRGPDADGRVSACPGVTVGGPGAGAVGGPGFRRGRSQARVRRTLVASRRERRARRTARGSVSSRSGSAS
jgi:hypothetical protein